MLDLSPESLEDVPGARQRETDEIDHHVRLEGGDLPAEVPVCLFAPAVEGDPLDLPPGSCRAVRLSLAPAHADHLVPPLDQPGDQVCPDMSRCADDDNLHLPHYIHLTFGRLPP